MQTASPVLTEDRVIQDDLLQEFDELVGQVSGHEGLDSDRDLLWVLGLRQGCLHHLRQNSGEILRCPQGEEAIQYPDCIS